MAKNKVKNKVKITRESRQVSQAEVARLVGVSKQTLSAIEANKQEPSLQVALRIAKTLRAPIEQLFPIQDEHSMNSLSSQLETYQDILNSVFGEGVCTINTKQTGINNLLGGICLIEDSPSFRCNFIDRLHRLKSMYDTNEHCSKTIRRLAQEIGTGNGAGAYSELGAIDFIGRMFRHVIIEPAKLDVDISASRTFADSDPKRQIANLDGYIEEMNTYFDVKILQDITEGILFKPIAELSQKYSAGILTERDYAYDYSLLTKDLASIKIELEEALISKQTYLKVKCTRGLGFRIGWPPGVNQSTGILDPYKAADIKHKAIFDYASKFIRDAPFVLILVTPPWSDMLLGSFQDMDKTFYRALSRRVFCQYINSSEVHPKYGKTYAELSKAISMIVFLKLHDTLGEGKETITGHVFANPNASHRYSGFMRDFFNQQRIAIQDFDGDNY